MSTNKTKKLLFSANTTVRFDDLSYGRHLYAPKIVSLFDHCRSLFLKENGMSEDNIFGLSLMLKKLDVDYKNEAVLSDILETSLYINEIKGGTIDIHFDVIDLDNKETIGSGNALMVFYDFENKRVSRVPQEFINLISQ